LTTKGGINNLAEYNNQKYYWIKLTDNFLTSDTVDFLMSQKDGSNYVVLYQMLCLKTVNNNGELSRKLGEMIIPYDEEKITRDCKYFSVDTVRIALELFKKLGLIYEQENGILRISDFERLIGVQTAGAERRQIQRENQKDRQGRQKGDICHPDIDKDIDIRDKDIEIEKEIDTDKEKERVEKKESEHTHNIDYFLSQHTNVILANYSGKIDIMDFDRLSEEIEKSRYLKEISSFTFLQQNYEKIIEGYYRDRPKNKEQEKEEEPEERDPKIMYL